MIKAFIFDFDGLIINTEDACYEAWQEIYASFDTSLPLNEWVKCIGTSDDVCDPLGILATLSGKIIDQEDIRAQHFSRYTAKTKSMQANPGIREYLDWAMTNQIKLAVASSSSRNWVIPHLETLGLHDYFDIIQTRDDVHAVKPDPELFLSTKKLLNLGDYEAIIFEDSYNGIVAGTLSRLFTVAIPNRMTEKMDFSAANLVLPSLDTVSPSNLLKMLEIHV